MLIDYIKKHYNDIEADRQWSSGIRASNSGKCPRAIAYQFHNYEAIPLVWRARLVFRLGDLIEKDLVEVAEKYGLEGMQESCSVKIDDVEIFGHIDGRLNDCVVDFKSCTSRAFSSIKKASDYSDTHQTFTISREKWEFTIGTYAYQMHFYMKALGLKKALLVYYCKDTSALHEVAIPFHPDIWDQIEREFKSVLNSTKDTLPERKYQPNDKGVLPWQCSYCAYNRHCWPTYELEFDKDGKPRLTVKEQENENDIK